MLHRYSPHLPPPRVALPPREPDPLQLVQHNLLCPFINVLWLMGLVPLLMVLDLLPVKWPHPSLPMVQWWPHGLMKGLLLGVCLLLLSACGTLRFPVLTCPPVPVELMTPPAQPVLLRPG